VSGCPSRSPFAGTRNKIFAILPPDGRTAVLKITPADLDDLIQRDAETWRDGGKQDQNFLESESPLFIGRAIAALAQDKKVFSRTGDLTSSWELSREYGFTDHDGRRPDWGKHWEKILPAMSFMLEGYKRQAEWLHRMARRAEGYLGTIEPAA